MNPSTFFCHKDESVFVELRDGKVEKLLLESCWNSGLSGLVFSVKSLKKLLYLWRKPTNKQGETTGFLEDE